MVAHLCAFDHDVTYLAINVFFHVLGIRQYLSKLALDFLFLLPVQMGFRHV